MEELRDYHRRWQIFTMRRYPGWYRQAAPLRNQASQQSFCQFLLLQIPYVYSGAKALPSFLESQGTEVSCA
jgi:hypothetical protein